MQVALPLYVLDAVLSERVVDESEMVPTSGHDHRPSLNRPGLLRAPAETGLPLRTICEGCTFFLTTSEFRPTLQRQRDDAACKGQIGRQQIFDGLLQRLDHTGT